MATASTGLCVRPSSNPSMGVAPPEGGDCSRLAADRLFLFLCFLLSQEAEDATPSPEPGSPEVDSTCTKAGGEPSKDDGAPTSGTAAPSCKSPATTGTKTWVVSSVTSDGPGTTSVREVPQGCSPHRSNKLCPPRGWPTLLPRSRWHRLCTLPPRSRRHTATWASHGNCTSSHLGHQGGAKSTPPYRHGGKDLLHPLIILLVPDLYAPCHLEACLLQQALSLVRLLRHSGDWHRASPHLVVVYWGHKGRSQSAQTMSHRRLTPCGSSPAPTPLTAPA